MQRAGRYPVGSIGALFFFVFGIILLYGAPLQLSAAPGALRRSDDFSSGWSIGQPLVFKALRGFDQLRGRAPARAAAAAVGSPSSSGLRFDGVDDRVTFGAAPSLGVSTFTIETWFRRDGPGATATTG